MARARAGRSASPPVSQTIRGSVADLESYSRRVVRLPLRPYQLEAGAAIVASALGERARDLIVVIMARQAGKNELSAQVEAYLLALHARQGGTIVKCAPTFHPQLYNSMQRLSDRGNNVLTTVRGRLGFILEIGRARAQFLSAASGAQVVGATASLALEVDEAQDCDEEKLTRDFYPMVASTNAPRIYYGTAWTEGDPLQRAKQTALALERRDGVRRVFEYPWWVVAEHNPAYRRHVEAERERLGADHPLFRTQYALEPASSAARLLGETQLALLQGEHRPLDEPTPGRSYVAGIDLAGPAEVDPADQGRRREVDRTVIAIAEVERSALAADPSAPPSVMARVVAAHIWEGRPHQAQLVDLVAILRRWRVGTAAVDASGLGQPIAELLAGALGAGRVRPVTMTSPSKSELGYALLSAINAGALTLPAADRDREPWRTFWREASACERTMRPGAMMAWRAPSGQHEDTLVALALVGQAARFAPPVHVAGMIAHPERYPGEGRY